MTGKIPLDAHRTRELMVAARQAAHDDPKAGLAWWRWCRPLMMALTPVVYDREHRRVLRDTPALARAFKAARLCVGVGRMHHGQCRLLAGLRRSPVPRQPAPSQRPDPLAAPGGRSMTVHEGRGAPGTLPDAIDFGMDRLPVPVDAAGRPVANGREEEA